MLCVEHSRSEFAVWDVLMNSAAVQAVRVRQTASDVGVGRSETYSLEAHAVTGSQLVASGRDWNSDTPLHVAHTRSANDVNARTWYVPAAQTADVEHAWAPVVLEKVPGAHAEHTRFDDGVGALSSNVPMPQGSLTGIQPKRPTFDWYSVTPLQAAHWRFEVGVDWTPV